MADSVSSSGVPPLFGGGEAGAAPRRGPAPRRDSGGLGREAAGSLVHDRLNGSSRLVIKPHRCLSWACPKCGVAYWAKVRERVLRHCKLFRKPRMLTFTVDRHGTTTGKGFDSGEAAFEYIEGKNGLIRRFLRLIGFKKAFKVLAFHPDAPDWPHWHLVVDIRDLGRWVDLKRLWKLWRDDWSVGRFDLQLGRKFATAADAFRYAASYCQQQAGIVPDWVKRRRRAPRCYELYGELRDADRAARAEQRADPAPAGVVDNRGDGEPATSKRRASTSTVNERLGGCGHGSVVIKESG